MDTGGALGYFIGIERRVSKIYCVFSQLFAEDPELKEFWRRMGEEEEIHSQILEIEKEFLETGVRVGDPVYVDKETREAIDTRLNRYEERIEKGVTLDEAFEIAVAIETSEVNYIFDRLVSAIESPVFRRMSQLYASVRGHDEYLVQGIERFTKNRSLIKKLQQATKASSISMT